MNRIKLRPCPFCGGEAAYTSTRHFCNYSCIGIHFEVGCKDCKMTLPEIYDIKFSLSENGELCTLKDDRAIAAENWNRRAGDTKKGIG